MNKLKHHFLWWLVFLGTISFWYIWYSAYTSLSIQNDWAVITKDIWNNVITAINDIWNRTDWIYSNNWNITIWNWLNNPISKINIYDKDNAWENVSIYKTTTSPNLDVYSTYDWSDDIQSWAIRYWVRPSDDSWQIWDKKSGSNWNNLVSVNSNWNVWIWTTTPQAKLDVNWTMKIWYWSNFYQLAISWNTTLNTTFSYDIYTCWWSHILDIDSTITHWTAWYRTTSHKKLYMDSYTTLSADTYLENSTPEAGSWSLQRIVTWNNWSWDTSNKLRITHNAGSYRWGANYYIYIKSTCPIYKF